MSVQAMASVFMNSKLGGTTRLVLLAIGNYYGDVGAWPSIDSLARDCLMSRRAVQDCIRRAEVAGELHVEKNAGVRGTNRYWLHILQGGCRFCTHADVRRESAPEPLGTGVKGSVTASASSHLKVIPDDAFETFFGVFPTARKGSRREVRKAWDKAIQREQPSFIIAAAIAYRDDPNREDGFTAGGARWLNRDGWEEGPIPERNGHSTNVIDAAYRKAKGMR